MPNKTTLKTIGVPITMLVIVVTVFLALDKKQDGAIGRNAEDIKATVKRVGAVETGQKLTEQSMKVIAEEIKDISRDVRWTRDQIMSRWNVPPPKEPG